MDFVHPQLPVLDIHEPCSALECGRDPSKVSLFLLLAFMLVALPFADLAIVMSAGFSSKIAASEALSARLEVSKETVSSFLRRKC